MTIIGNFKIPHGGRPPCWTSVCAVYSRNYHKSNSEENISNHVILGETYTKLLAI